MNSHKLVKEIKRLKAAFGYSMDGFKAAWQEPAFRLEMILCIIAIPAALIFADSNIEKAILIGSLFLVLITELLNTGIEKAIDRVSLEIHPLSKKAKDIASAAVLLSLINAAVIWLVIMWN